VICLPDGHRYNGLQTLSRDFRVLMFLDCSLSMSTHRVVKTHHVGPIHTGRLLSSLLKRKSKSPSNHRRVKEPLVQRFHTQRAMHRVMKSHNTTRLPMSVYIQTTSHRVMGRTPISTNARKMDMSLILREPPWATPCANH